MSKISKKLCKLAIEAINEASPAATIDLVARTVIAYVIDSSMPTSGRMRNIDTPMLDIMLKLNTCSYMVAMGLLSHDYEKAIKMSTDVLDKAVTQFMEIEIPQAVRSSAAAGYEVPPAVLSGLVKYSQHIANRKEAEDATEVNSTAPTS